MTYQYNLGLAFQEISKRFAEYTALRFMNGDSISYCELDQISNRIARGLLQRGLVHRDVIGLFNAKTAYGFAAMLAALKIGAAYVNLDDQNPAQRVEKILLSCSPRLIVADLAIPAPLWDLCSGMGLAPVSLEELALDNSLSDQRLPQTAQVIGSDPAYLMFTSGSTGVPKGTMIAHQSVLNFIMWSQAQFSIEPSDILTNVNPMYFDNSVFDFYSALFSGATLVPAPREIVKYPAKVVSMVETAKCTLWFSVPSMLIYLMAMKQLSSSTWPSMRRIVFGGEGYPIAELKKLFAVFGHRTQLVNVYGPTECTCICSAHLVSPSDLSGTQGLPPLGRIAPNFGYVILRDDGQQASHNIAGELCLFGPQVGLGYYNDPQRTSASFAPIQLSAARTERMYRTGDLVREDENALLWFVGRKDNQIKHMGYRIELEDIEVALNDLPGIIQSVAVYQQIRDQHGQIIAFIATLDGLEEQDIRENLRAYLPDYMIPSRILVLRNLPKNANGKVDRKALMESIGTALPDNLV